MKRVLILAALLCCGIFSSAQKNLPVGQIFDICEIEQNDNRYSIFKYKDEDGTIAYYLNLGRVTFDTEWILGTEAKGSFSMGEQTCLIMGADAEQAIAFMNSMLELLQDEPGESKEFICRNNNGLKFTDLGTANAVVAKGFFGEKRLDFSFVCNGKDGQASISKGTLKSLISSLKFNRKLHPDW